MQNSPIEAWHQVVKTKDPAALNAILADNASFVSPLLNTPQVGKKLAAMYLMGASHVLGNGSFTYVRELFGERDAMLEFECVLDGLTVNGVDIIKWNDDGKIVEFKVMLRPFKATTLVGQKMAALLETMK
ncbi:MAG: hypothetical protein ACI9HX_000744 [Pseudoalteromonas tetraodonis]|jgi:hypothetical protein